jgi:hypothetical protein
MNQNKETYQLINEMSRNIIFIDENVKNKITKNLR